MVDVAVGIHRPCWAVELDRCLDEPGEEENEEYEGAEHHYAREKLPLCDEAEYDGDEEDADRAGSDRVGKYPVTEVSEILDVLWETWIYTNHGEPT